MMWSSASKNKMPTQNPSTAGRNDHRPSAADCAMAGISRLHTLAATITPAAKPVSARCTASLSVFFQEEHARRPQ